MNPSAVTIAPWPLGKKFVDAKGRIFEVVQTIYGDVNAPALFKITLENGWSIAWERRDSQQTAVGFKQVGTDKLIIQPIDVLDQHVKNGHLKLL